MKPEALKNKKRAICSDSIENAPDFEFDMFYGRDIKSAVEWYKKYLDNPIGYFIDYPNQEKPFWKYVGCNPKIMIPQELNNYRVSFNYWLLKRAFEDVTKNEASRFNKTK